MKIIESNAVKFATTQNICDIYEVTSRTVANWRKNGMPHEKIGRNMVRYEIDKVSNWLKDRGQSA